MQVVGTFNKLSEQLRKLIVPLKPGQFAEYQRLAFHELKELNPDMSRKSSRVYPHQELFIRDTIWDPWAGDVGSDGEPVGGMVEIGIPAKNGINRKEGTITSFERFTLERSTFGGVVVLDGKLPIHREIHEFLQISNINLHPVQGDKNRNPEVDFLLSLIDRKKESTQKSTSFQNKKNMLVYVSNMGMEDIREFAAGKNWDYKADPDLLAAQIQDYADQYPDQMAKDIADPNMKKKATIKYALSEQRIQFDPVQYRILWNNGQTLAQLERVKDKNEVDAFLTFLDTSANGPKILQQLSKKTPKPVEAE